MPRSDVDEAFFFGLSIGMHVMRDEVTIESGATGGIDARIDRIGLMISEEVHPRLSLGLIGGILSMDTSGQTLTEGMELTGSYVGVALRGIAFGAGRWRLGYELGLVYQSMEDEIDDQRVEMDWIDSNAAVTACFDITERVSVYAGSMSRNLEIDQRARGDTRSSAEFGERDSTGTILGLALEVDPGGFIDLAVHRGASDGYVLTFSREY